MHHSNTNRHEDKLNSKKDKPDSELNYRLLYTKRALRDEKKIKQKNNPKLIDDYNDLVRSMTVDPGLFLRHENFLVKRLQNQKFNISGDDGADVRIAWRRVENDKYAVQVCAINGHKWMYA